MGQFYRESGNKGEKQEMIHFEYPFLFLLLLIIPLLIYLKMKRKRGVIYPSIGILPNIKTLRIRMLFMGDLLFYLALILLITAAAGPYKTLGKEKDYSRGYLLQLVVDRSGSMGVSMDTQGEQNRLDIVKKVVAEFIDGDGNRLSGRRNDRIGLISFAQFADTMAPLTISHDIVVQLVNSLKLAEKEEDGTSLGDALALAVARVKAYQQKTETNTGAVIILLTDGQNNSGSMDPMDAAKMAEEQGIKVYTIGFGGGYYRNAFGLIQEIPPEYGIDEVTLQKMAEATGGKFFNAGDEKALKNVYSKIDSLEKVDMENLRSLDKRLFFYPLLFAGFVLLMTGFFFKYLFFNVLEDEL